MKTFLNLKPKAQFEMSLYTVLTSLMLVRQFPHTNGDNLHAFFLYAGYKRAGKFLKGLCKDRNALTIYCARDDKGCGHTDSSRDFIGYSLILWSVTVGDINEYEMKVILFKIPNKHFISAQGQFIPNGEATKCVP